MKKKTYTQAHIVFATAGLMKSIWYRCTVKIIGFLFSYDSGRQYVREPVRNDNLMLWFNEEDERRQSC